MQNNCHLGLSFSERYFQMAEIKYQNGRTFIKCLDEIENSLDYNIEELPDLIYRPDFIFEMISNLKELLARNRITTNEVSFSLDSSSFFISVLPVDTALSRNEFQEHLRWEVSSVFPYCSPDAFHINSSVLAEKADYKKILMVVIRKDIVKFFRDLLKKMNLKLYQFEVDYFASISAFIHNYPEATQVETGFVKINGRKIEISSITDKQVNKYMCFRLQPEISLNGRLEQIDKELLKNKMFFFGSTVDEPSFKSNNQDLKVSNLEIFNPFRKIEISPELPRRQEFMLNRSAFAPSVGLALRKIL